MNHQRIRDIPDPYLLCRAFRHAWEDFTPLSRTRKEADTSLRCARCGGERHDTIGRASRRVMKRQYHMVRDYPGWLATSDALMEVLRRYEGMAASSTGKKKGTRRRLQLVS